MTIVEKNLRTVPRCLLGLCLGVFLNGCDSVKKTMGMTRPETDPYLVIGEEMPLIVPPGVRNRPLPEPQPGSPRPQKWSSSDSAHDVLVNRGRASQEDTDPVITPVKNPNASVLIQQAQSSAERASSQ